MDASTSKAEAQKQTEAAKESEPSQEYLNTTSSAEKPGPETDVPETSAPPQVLPAGGQELIPPRILLSPPMEQQSGIVSSDLESVSEFDKLDSDESESTPPGKETVGSSPYKSEPKTLGGPMPPSKGRSRIEVAPLSNYPESKTTSTLELAADRDSYPEVYVAEEQHGGVLPLKSTTPGSYPMGDRAPTSTSSPTYYSKVGYIENNDMSTHPIAPGVPTVVPLHLLGDQSDIVDCPFCLKRVETRIKKRATQKTHILGGLCCLATLFGTPVPYLCGWYADVEHHCKNCRRKVAQRRFDSKDFEPLGIRADLREVSRFEAAENLKKTRPEFCS